MTTSELTSQFAELEAHISREKGPFTLFALFMREDVPDRWDLIVSAPWADGDKQDVTRYLIRMIKSSVGARGLTNLARIVVADPEHPAVRALNGVVAIEHGNVEVKDSNFFGLPIKHAYIITSKRRPAPAAA